MGAGFGLLMSRVEDLDGQSLSDSGQSSAVERLFAAMRGGETRALARAVSLVEDGGFGAEELLGLCRLALVKQVRALRVGVTGPAGAGKSTLVDALTRELRGQGRRVGIVAVDPSSPFSGGAILGDRIRFGETAADPGVFLRSMATRGHLGGLAEATEDVLTVIEAAWSSDAGGAHAEKNVLLIETTGVGQGEIEVVGLADLVAVVLVPGMGDAVQSLKAGVLEIASVYVLNKADREGVERLESEIGEMLALAHVVSGGKAGPLVRPRVLKTVATTGVGVAELLAVIDEIGGSDTDRMRDRGVDRVRRAVPVAVLDHIGIAVQSLSAAQGLYAALGVRISAVEEVAQERVRVVMMAVGESRIELLEATSEDSTVGRFVARRGEGIHHIALRVADLAAMVERLQGQGVRLVSEAIQVGAGGHRYVFVHPASANGVLVELVEAAAEGADH